MGKIILNEIEYTDSGLDYVELRQEEYDALSEAEQNDGTVYFITDATDNEESYVAPIIYSKNEREVGVHIDGKPLYEKTLLYEHITRGRVNNLAHNINNIESVVNVKWAFPSASNPGSVIIGHETTDYNYWAQVFEVTNTGIYYRFGNSWGDCNLLITIQYTKTTDTPGSGKWTTSGVPAVHYSTDEHVVGTWIDGSTVYEKTYEVTGINADYNYVIDANFTQSAIKLLPGCSAVLRTTGTYNTDFSLDVLDDNSTGIRLFTNVNGLNFNVTKYNSHSSHYGTCSAVVTIRYTKTS